jgi:hypothetical protein
MKASFANNEVTSLEELFPESDNKDKARDTNGKTEDKLNLMEGKKAFLIEKEKHEGRCQVLR